VGKKLRLQTLGRKDLLRVKLFALCDRGIDLGDFLALAPTEEELALLRLVKPMYCGRASASLDERHAARSMVEKSGHRV
jgi:hypothetical protein